MAGEERVGWSTTSTNRTKIEDKLAEDESRLKELQASLVQSEELTGGMVQILDSFTSRLKKLDDTILPVYNETLHLTRLQENVEKGLMWIQRVIGFYQVSEDVEVKIREGPSGELESYLAVLEQLREAMDHFNQFNSHSMELDNLNELFFNGMEALIREFRQLLQKHSKPVHVATLHDIAQCEDMEDMPAITLLPAKIVNDLRVIATYLVKSPGDNHTDIMSLYAQIRCNQLGRAMNSLLQNSQGQSLLPPTVPKKTNFTTSFLKAGLTPNRKGGGRKGGASGGGPAISAEPSGLSLFDETLEGCSSFMVAATVFLRLIQSEVRLMEEVIPQPHHSHVLDSFIKQPMDFFMSRGETLFQQARKNIGHHEYSVVLSCLRLLRHVKNLLPEYRVVLLGLESKPYDRFVHLLQQFDRLCSKSLQDDFIQYIKVDPEKQSNLPKDGTVHSLTSSTMRFVEELLEFDNFLGDIFQGQNSFSLGQGSSESEKEKAVGSYLVRVLDALNLNMENKARNFESQTLSAIFLLNNFHFVHKTFSQNDRLLTLLERGMVDIEDHYIGLVAQQNRSYQRGFNKLISYLGQEVSLANISSGDKLSNQKRQLLKDKFKGFNTELEDLQRVQRDWSIPDHTLRGRVRNDNVELVVPLYTTFHKMYAALGFTKNSEKYLKYTPDSLNQVLLTFFDGGAA